jgi:hypothetical protein
MKSEWTEKQRFTNRETRIANEEATKAFTSTEVEKVFVVFLF